MNNMKNNNYTTGGFTLIETMVSVMILTVALSAFMTLVASSLYSARYANNEITANYLAQEVVDGIRNDRDNFFQQQASTGGNGWYNFTTKYGAPSSKCFDSNGCQFPVTLISNSEFSEDLSVCNPCTVLGYDSTGANGSFYNYGSGTNTTFKRQVKMSTNTDVPTGLKELYVTVTVEWKNGSSVRSRVLKSSLTNWQQ
jgi:prepilin-type N-terminal cleavage/methylation domain-containing protein